jgi:hypothetical protein
VQIILLFKFKIISVIIFYNKILNLNNYVYIFLIENLFYIIFFFILFTKLGIKNYVESHAVDNLAMLKQE